MDNCLAYKTLKLDKYDELSIEQYAVLKLDPIYQQLLEITNIGNQTIKIGVNKPFSEDDTIFKKSGIIQLRSGTKIVVEDYRVQLLQLISIQKKRLISLRYIQTCD